MTFNTVVEYVKNLFPGRAPALPVANMQSDAEIIAHLSYHKFYTTARNGIGYLYCVVFPDDIGTVMNLFNRNGVKCEKHLSRYDCRGSHWVVRIRKSFLQNNEKAKDFVKLVIETNASGKKNTWLENYLRQRYLKTTKTSETKTR